MSKVPIFARFVSSTTEESEGRHKQGRAWPFEEYLNARTSPTRALDASMLSNEVGSRTDGMRVSIIGSSPNGVSLGHRLRLGISH